MWGMTANQAMGQMSEEAHPPPLPSPRKHEQWSETLILCPRPSSGAGEGWKSGGGGGSCLLATMQPTVC